MLKLTKAQERAKAKLTGSWQSPYMLGETIPTLEGLVRREIAERARKRFGSLFFPRSATYYRLRSDDDGTN